MNAEAPSFAPAEVGTSFGRGLSRGTSFSEMSPAIDIPGGSRETAAPSPFSLPHYEATLPSMDDYTIGVQEVEAATPWITADHPEKAGEEGQPYGIDARDPLDKQVPSQELSLFFPETIFPESEITPAESEEPILTEERTGFSENPNEAIPFGIIGEIPDVHEGEEEPDALRQSLPEVSYIISHADVQMITDTVEDMLQEDKAQDLAVTDDVTIAEPTAEPVQEETPKIPPAGGKTDEIRIDGVGEDGKVDVSSAQSTIGETLVVTEKGEEITEIISQTLGEENAQAIATDILQEAVSQDGLGAYLTDPDAAVKPLLEPLAQIGEGKTDDVTMEEGEIVLFHNTVTEQQITQVLETEYETAAQDDTLVKTITRQLQEEIDKTPAGSASVDRSASQAVQSQLVGGDPKSFKWSKRRPGSIRIEGVKDTKTAKERKKRVAEGTHAVQGEQENGGTPADGQAIVAHTILDDEKVKSEPLQQSVYEDGSLAYIREALAALITPEDFMQETVETKEEKILEDNIPVRFVVTPGSERKATKDEIEKVFS